MKANFKSFNIDPKRWMGENEGGGEMEGGWLNRDYIVGNYTAWKFSIDSFFIG